MTESFFASLKAMPDDPILGLNEQFKVDKRARKVNLGVGVYLNGDGKLPLLKTVETAEQRLVARQTTHGYTPMSGNPLFCDAVQRLVFGECTARTAGFITTVQTLGGTGALRLGAVLAHDFLHLNQARVSNPTWGNHITLLEHAGFETDRYPYYDACTHDVDVNGLLALLDTLEEGTVVLLHACCHNPTGADLRKADWEKVLEIVKRRHLLAFFDMAYQGLGHGLEEDAQAIRMFADAGLNLLVATSCSKNFGLYGERVGALHVVTHSQEEAHTVLSILKAIARSEYSNPPSHGANVVTEILTTPELYTEWVAEVASMRQRIQAMRQALAEEAKKTGIDLDFVRRQIGMFSFTGLSKAQMVTLREEHAVYGVENSRICLAGLNEHNVQHVAEAIADVI